MGEQVAALITADVIAHRSKVSSRTRYLCRCYRTIRFAPGVYRMACLCGLQHVRGHEAEKLREMNPREYSVAEESAVPSQTIFRPTEASCVIVSGADQLYGIDPTHMRFVCTRLGCNWTGRERDLATHHDQHLREMAARDERQHLQTMKQEIAQGLARSRGRKR